MIQVKILKQINRRVFKNASGYISDADYQNYGIGENPDFYRKIEVHIDGVTYLILNTDLELMENENHGTTTRAKSKEQYKLF